MGYDENNKFSMPIIHVIMPNKSFVSYYRVLQEIINLLNQYKLNINFKDKVIKYDFEKWLLFQ